MFLYSLLEVSKQATTIVWWISIGAVVILFGLIALISIFYKKRRDARQLAFAGICIALSFILAVLKFSLIPSGGSVTLASFVPIMLYAYVYGPIDGLMVGLIHGLLNFIEDPYILNPATFLLDYLLAFASIAVIGFFNKTSSRKKAVKPLAIGCTCVYALRFLAHYLSGIIFFLNNSVWVTLPAWATANAFIYSLIYQCIYIPLDFVISLSVLILLAKAGVVDKIAKTVNAKG